jgi:pantoate--beta-alanine ligase
MRAGSLHAESVGVSLFVNPTQFAPHEDLSRYPRGEDEDFALAEASGVDLIFAPSAEEMYGKARSQVVVQGSALGFEGDMRPTHFNGVATVVLKLFLLFRPQVAIFGWKDLQQCSVISQMVRDLDVPVSLVFEETVREPGGLAMSSRNRYLSKEHREEANALSRILFATANVLACSPFDQASILDGARQQLVDKGFSPDYIAVVDPTTMETLPEAKPGSRIVVAARFFGVRLLDNVPIPTDFSH